MKNLGTSGFVPIIPMKKYCGIRMLATQLPYNGWMIAYVYPEAYGHGSSSWNINLYAMELSIGINLIVLIVFLI